MEKSRLVRQGCERKEGQPLAARSWPQAAHRAASAKGVASDGADSQPTEHRGLEAVREGMKQRESGRQNSLSAGESSESFA